MGRSTEPWPVRLYPRWWRERYADEMTAILGADPLRPAAIVDLVRGAIDAHLVGDARPSRRGPAAMVLAGGSWTMIGAAAIAAPAPPDWPGYLIETLPLGAVGAVTVLVAVLSVAKRGWAISGRTAELLVLGAVVAHLGWAGSLLMALVGGPYGAVTAVIQSMAAIATAGIGLQRTQAGDQPAGVMTAIAGVAFLIPTPAGWLLGGAAWTALGIGLLVGRWPGDDRRMAD